MNNYIQNNCVIIDNDKIIIDGKNLPPCPVKRNKIKVIGKKVYINGYEYKKDKWKRTLKAIWYKCF